MINRTRQTPQHEIARRLPAVEREIRDLKNKQLLGGDTLYIVGTSLATITDTIAPGGESFYTLTFTPVVPRIPDERLAFSFFVDNDGDISYANPNGINLTADQKKVSYEGPRYDWAQSDDVSGLRVYFVKVRNGGSSSHTIYSKFKFYSPKVTATSGAS